MLAGLLVYVAIQLLIGVLVSRRIRSEDDYLVAGRRLGPLLAGISIFATWFGAESCVGAAGAVYRDGVNRHSVEPFAYGLCLVLMGLFFAAAFWRSGIITLADLFQRRYGNAVERVAAVLLIPTSVLWAAAQIRAFGHVLAVASDGWLGDGAGIAAAALVVMLYTGFGGLLADVVTDVLQGGLLVIGLLVLLVAVTQQAGGVDAVLQQLPERVHLLGGEQPGWLATAEAWAIPLIGSLVAQEAISRSLAARSPTIARRAAVLGGLGYLLVGLIPVTLGIVGPSLVPDLADGEQLLPTLANLHLHPVLFVAFAGALISAILSTVDSALLVAAGVLSRNVILAGGRAAGDRTRLRLARLSVLACGVAAWLCAQLGEGVAALVEEASAFGSAGIFVIVALGLFTRLGGAVAANASLLAGVAAWLLGHWLLPAVTGLELPYPYLLSLAAAVLGFGAGLAWERTRRTP